MVSRGFISIEPLLPTTYYEEQRVYRWRLLQNSVKLWQNFKVVKKRNTYYYSSSIWQKIQIVTKIYIS